MHVLTIITCDTLAPPDVQPTPMVCSCNKIPWKLSIQAQPPLCISLPQLPIAHLPFPHSGYTSSAQQQVNPLGAFSTVALNNHCTTSPPQHLSPQHASPRCVHIGSAHAHQRCHGHAAITAAQLLPDHDQQVGQYASDIATEGPQTGWDKHTAQCRGWWKPRMQCRSTSTQSPCIIWCGGPSIRCHDRSCISTSLDLDRGTSRHCTITHHDIPHLRGGGGGMAMPQLVNVTRDQIPRT